MARRHYRSIDPGISAGAPSRPSNAGFIASTSIIGQNSTNVRWDRVAGRASARDGRPASSSRVNRKNRLQNLATERKYVSILRADLHRSSDLVTGLDLEDSIARLAPAMEQMRSAAHQYGGIIHREMGDGIFAVFGAPIANDMHAVMACLAALDLLRRIEALADGSIRVRVGVHSGLVVAGPRKLDYTQMYDFDGPPLIMAERLQAVAEPGQALASEACWMLASPGGSRHGSRISTSGHKRCRTHQRRLADHVQGTDSARIHGSPLRCQRANPGAFS